MVQSPLAFLMTAALIRDVQNSVIPVQFNKTYRFHIVNLGAIAFFHFWIEKHNLTVIEVDGVYVQPYVTQGLDVAVGQRYSVLVTMNATSTYNYPIVAAMDGLRSPSRRPNTTAWLQYNGSSPLPPAAILSAFYPFEDTNIIPLVPVPVSNADHNVTLAVTFAQRPSDGNFIAQINGVSYLAPDKPTMLTAMDAISPLEPYNYGATTNSYIVRYKRMVWLIIENQTGGNHPCKLCYLRIH
jgi:iron transport multicopper oxidase